MLREFFHAIFHRNKTNRHQESFVLDPPSPIDKSELRAGDILLHYHSAWNLVGRFIAWKTKSPYTHASIYLGDNKIAEAVPKWIRTYDLDKAIKQSKYIVVLRSQMGFGPERTHLLRIFIDNLIKRRSRYDFPGAWALRNTAVNNEVDTNALHKLATYYESAPFPKDRTRNSYFCSALVASCYCAVGIIEESAEVVLNPKLFTPIGLADEPSFGYPYGYLMNEGTVIDTDDKFQKTSSYKAIMGCDYV